MQLKALVIFLLLFSTACKDARQEKSKLETQKKNEQVNFDEMKWKTKEGGDYPFRDNMYQDLMNDAKFRTAEKETVLSLLGEPDRTNADYLYYTLKQRRIGGWPLHTKTLVIKMFADSTIQWIKIHE